jgi:hypothetical protein
VSEQEHPTAPRDKVAPSATVRLAWWFGIYFAAQLPLVTCIAGFYLFPLGLARLVVSAGGSGSMPGGIMLFLVVLPYLFYIVHFLVAMNTRSKATFQILMVVLLVVVIFNLVGCESTMDGLHNIN